MMRKQTYQRLQSTIAAQTRHFFEKAISARYGYRADIHMDTIDAYLRFDQRDFSGTSYWCLDIAKIWIKERYRGRGHFSLFMDVVDSLNPGNALYLECVHSPLLINWAYRHGWHKEPVLAELEVYNLAPSFFFIRESCPLSEVGLAWKAPALSQLKTYEQWRSTRLSQKTRESG